MGVIENQKARGGEGWSAAGVIWSSDARHGGGGGSTGRIDVSTYSIQLSVVEHVEVFPAEFEGIALFKRKTLEKAEIEVDAARKSQVVAGHRAECEAGGKRESRGVVVEHAEDRLVGEFRSLRLGDVVGVTD